MRLDAIEAVGFDMDYTLATYRQPEMDRVQIEATLPLLVEAGWPDSLLGIHYRTDFAVRGLLVDKELGNVVKMDRYRYVKRAYHGFTELNRAVRGDLYTKARLRPSSERFHWIDTLYGLTEVTLYAAAIDHLEGLGLEVDYAKLFADVRRCIDAGHRDGAILAAITGDVERFIDRDPLVPATLRQFRESGKKVFLLTNSYPDYTSTLMDYLFAEDPEPSWRKHFDLAVCASTKPLFFTGREPFELVTPAGAGGECEILRGGNIVDFADLLDCRGDRVLYVGDHIYGDVLRAKVSTGWRTAMVIQEMESEIDAYATGRDVIRQIDGLGVLRELYDDQLRIARAGVRAATEAEVESAEAEVDRIIGRLVDIDAEIELLENRFDGLCHPFWGSLFKAGTETSSFGDQVEVYACLYTDRVSSFGEYSASHYFRSPRGRMSHEL